jgi:hypothetical protein
LGKTSALRFENVKFFKKPALYALKTLNFKLTLPSLALRELSGDRGKLIREKKPEVKNLVTLSL